MQGLVGIEDLEVPADNLDGADEDPQMRLRYLRPGDRLEVRTQSFKESWKFQVLSPRSHHRQTDEAEIPIDVDYPPGEEDHFEFFKSVFAGTHEVFAGQPYPWALATSDPAYPAYSLLQDLDTSQATSMASARLDARWVVVHDHRGGRRPTRIERIRIPNVATTFPRLDESGDRATQRTGWRGFRAFARWTSDVVMRRAAALRRRPHGLAGAGTRISRLYSTGTTPSVSTVPNATPKEMTIAML